MFIECQDLVELFYRQGFPGSNPEGSFGFRTPCLLIKRFKSQDYLVRLENDTGVDKMYQEDLNYEMLSVTYWISLVPKPLEIRSLSKTTYVEASSSAPSRRHSRSDTAI